MLCNVRVAYWIEQCSKTFTAAFKKIMISREILQVIIYYNKMKKCR